MAVILPLKAGDFLFSKSSHHRADHHVGEGGCQRIDENRVGEGNTGLVILPFRRVEFWFSAVGSEEFCTQVSKSRSSFYLAIVGVFFRVGVDWEVPTPC